MSVLLSDYGVLAVGDVHIAQGQDVSRADLLGKTIRELKPKEVVFIGDFMTFDAFSNWDKDKRKLMENRRYEKEIAKGCEFIDRMKKHAGKYQPEYTFVEGNHEDRVSRYLDTKPELCGAINYRRDLGIQDWKFVPYKEYTYIHGIGYTHIPISEAGKPIGGRYVSQKALDLHQGSVIFGHTHKLQTASVCRHGSPHLSQALNIGCFFNHVDAYAIGSVTSYWRGLVYIDHYKKGRFGWTPLSMGKLRQRYGEGKGTKEDTNG